MAGSSIFAVMTNIFVTEFSETFRKNSIVYLSFEKCSDSVVRKIYASNLKADL